MDRKPGMFRSWPEAVVSILLLAAIVLWLVSPIVFIALEIAD